MKSINRKGRKVHLSWSFGGQRSRKGRKDDPGHPL